MMNNRYIFAIYCLFAFTACQKDLMVSFSETNITITNNKLVEINIPKAMGNSTTADAINAEITHIVVDRLHIGDSDTSSSKSIEESITLFNDEYKSFKTDFPESLQIWDAQIDGEVIFQSLDIISISITSYVNTGGAHGITLVILLNFDAQSGKRIPNEALFNNIEAFETIAKGYFDNAIEDKNTLFEPNKFQLPANIGYSEDGLVLVYNVYEIAPYATGLIDFTIPFDKVDSVLVLDSSR